MRYYGKSIVAVVLHDIGHFERMMEAEIRHRTEELIRAELDKLEREFVHGTAEAGPVPRGLLAVDVPRPTPAMPTMHKVKRGKWQSKHDRWR